MIVCISRDRTSEIGWRKNWVTVLWQQEPLDVCWEWRLFRARTSRMELRACEISALLLSPVSETVYISIVLRWSLKLPESTYCAPLWRQSRMCGKETSPLAIPWSPEKRIFHNRDVTSCRAASVRCPVRRIHEGAMASICRRWRIWILPVLTCLYALLIVIIVPILLVNSIKNGFKKQDQAALVGGAFVLLALPIAFYEIIQHMIYYTQPRLQKYIIRWTSCH